MKKLILALSILMLSGCGESNEQIQNGVQHQDTQHQQNNQHQNTNQESSEDSGGIMIIPTSGGGLMFLPY